MTKLDVAVFLFIWSWCNLGLAWFIHHKARRLMNKSGELRNEAQGLLDEHAVYIEEAMAWLAVLNNRE